MMKIYKITLRTQLRALRELIILSLVYLSFICLIYLQAENDLFITLLFSTFFIYIVIFFLPVIFLHINYFINNNFKKIIIEKDKLMLDKTAYKSEDIDKVNIYATYQHFNNSVGVTALPYNDYYYYLEIHLKNGDRLVLSSLIDYRLDIIFKENFKTVNIIEKPSNYLFLFIKK